MIRIQRKRTKGYRLPPGAVYVGRPTLFGNPWTLRDAAFRLVPPAERSAWTVERYRRELEHFGLLTDYYWVSERGADRWRRWLDEVEGRTMVDLIRHALRAATALACWCPLCPAHADGLPAGVTCPDCAPCHASVLIELLADPEPAP